MTGLELTALTNNIMALHGFLGAAVLLQLRFFFPYVDNRLVRIARAAAVMPFAFALHRAWWNVGIFTGNEADHGLGWCTASDVFCRYANWAMEYSSLLLLPIGLGALASVYFLFELRPRFLLKLLAVYLAFQVATGAVAVYIA